MPTFEVSIEDQDATDVARRLLGPSAAQTDEEEEEDREDIAMSEFVQLAFDEYLDWLLGRTRFRSLSELQIDRVAAIYERIIPNEIPSTSRLYNDFGLSHGQATYVARVLADRQLSTWRETAKKELSKQLEGKLEKAKENKDDGRGEAELQLTLSRLAAKELELVFESTFANDSLIAPPRRSSSVGDLLFIAVESATLIALALHLGLEDD